MNIYAPNNTGSEYMKQNLTGLQEVKIKKLKLKILIHRSLKLLYQIKQNKPIYQRSEK